MTVGSTFNHQGSSFQNMPYNPGSTIFQIWTLAQSLLSFSSETLEANNSLIINSFNYFRIPE